MKLRHRRMERHLLTGVNLGQEITSDEAITILKGMKGQVDNGRSYIRKIFGGESNDSMATS